MNFTFSHKILCVTVIALGLNISSGQKHEWGGWGQWSSCSVTCGYGTMARIAYWYDGQGHVTNKTISVNSGCYIDKLCPVDGNWTMWSPWGPCSKICGTGRWSRTRSCANPIPSNGGMQCSGVDTEVEDCLINECPEIPPDFKLSSCTKEHFMCSSKRQCVVAHQKCDRKIQCHDGSDEKDCHSHFNGQSSIYYHSNVIYMSIVILVSTLVCRYS